MRAIILVLVVVIIAVIAAIATGFIDINQIRGAKAPADHSDAQRRDGQGWAGAGVRCRDRVGEGRRVQHHGEGAEARSRAAAEPGCRGDEQRNVTCVTGSASRSA